MAKEIKTPEELVSDSASVEMIKKSQDDCVETCFSRADLQSVVCKFGTQGICCKICHMGPCKITPKAPTGICGADADTIVARNFLREVAAGTAAHSDHGRHLVLLLKKVSEGKEKDYKIGDKKALLRISKKFNIETDNRETNEIAHDLADFFLAQFSHQEKKLDTLSLRLKKLSKFGKQKM